MLSEDLIRELSKAAAQLFEVAGIAVIVAGTLAALVLWARRSVGREAPNGEHEDPVSGFRRNLGRSILVGLELLVAADIIRTVAIDPSMKSVLVLGLIVLIRTFLSFSLEVEIDGRWPWQKDQPGNG
jgi:uncharacterized membrane protein